MLALNTTSKRWKYVVEKIGKQPVLISDWAVSQKCYLLFAMIEVSVSFFMQVHILGEYG